MFCDQVRNCFYYKFSIVTRSLNKMYLVDSLTFPQYSVVDRIDSQGLGYKYLYIYIYMYYIYYSRKKIPAPCSRLNIILKITGTFTFGQLYFYIKKNKHVLT
jgi:hypothetical protein